MLRKLFLYIPALLGIAAFWFTVGQPQRITETGLAAGHRLQSVSYAPFAKDQSPFRFAEGQTISEHLLDTDLAILSRNFSCIRTYSVHGLDALPKYAEKYGMQILLGAWVSGNREATMQELEGVIAFARKHPALIQAVVVGNETLLRREVSASQLGAYIRHVKSALPEVPVTYADVWEYWLKHPEVAADVDFVTVHILPYWEDHPVAIDEALTHVRTVYEEVGKKIPGKELLIGETGWPSRGRMRDGALPSPANQARYLRGFIRLAEEQAWQYNVIEAFDQPWKRMKEGVVGGYWGLYDSGRDDKQVLSGEVSVFPGWRALLGMSAGIALLALAVTPLPATMRVGAGPRLSAALAAGAVLLVWQGEACSTMLIDRLDLPWYSLVLAISAGTYLLGLRGIASGAARGHSPQPTASLLASLLRLAAPACALVAATGLAFDGRYQSFLNAAFAIPALVFVLLNGKNQTRPATGMLEKCLAVLLAAAGLSIFLQEPLNLQAAGWASICLLLAYPLWSRGRHASLRPLLPFALFALVAGGLAYAARLKILAAQELVAVCGESPDIMVCRVRALLGRMIDLKAYGWSALLLAALAIWSNLPPLTLLALVAVMASLIFYNAGMGAVAMLLLLLALTLPRPSRR